MDVVSRHIVTQLRSFFRYYRGQVMPLSHEEEAREQERENQETATSRTTASALKDLTNSIDTQTQQQQQHRNRYEGMECKNLLDQEVSFRKFLSQCALFGPAPLSVYLGLLQSNPQLNKVMLASEIRSSPRLIMSALDNCTRLKDLKVHRFNMDDREALGLGRFLRPVSATLTPLYLVGIEGGRFEPTTIWLPLVTNLTISVSDDSETHTCLGLQELPARCPSLEHLTIFPLELSTKLDRLGAIIKDHCSKLTSILVPPTLSTDKEICKVIRAVTAGRLLELQCTVSRITKELQEVIWANRDSLEVFKMAVAFYIREPVNYVNGREAGAAQLAAEEMRFLQEVVDSFLSLKVLSFYEWRERTSEFEFYDALMNKPWKCLSLEQLELFGGIHDVCQQEVLVAPGKLFGGGWRRIFMDGDQIGKEIARPDYGLLRRFIRHVSPLPRLRTMKAVRITCVRNVDKR
ncbi:hypothetical protein BG015_004927 [Linnemannia schmuckeri]|uniref:Uncharacterized protein n=1 Tax=Linnemannia schmuckeri TaxID=64567 RepID=A0A9P5VCU0_9FUNG|nr:hypothetical protein BG015_004927 [Linnemannia schmuckeri]